MKYQKKGWILVAIVLLLSGCGEDTVTQKTQTVSNEVIKTYVHKVIPEPEEPEPETTQVPSGNNSEAPQEFVLPDGYEEINDIVSVDASTLNLRSEPSLEAQVIAKAKRGETYTRLAKGKDGWDILLYGDQMVYAYAKYLKSAEETSALSLEFYLADVKKN